MADTHKQNARAGMGKAGAGRCQACVHEGHAQVGASLQNVPPLQTFASQVFNVFELRTLVVSVSVGQRRPLLKDGAHKQGTDTCSQRAFSMSALSTSLLCCRFCFWKHAQCAEQSTRRWIVCGSPGVLPCSTGWQLLCVKPLPVTQLLDHHLFPQICLNASCLPGALPCRASEGSWISRQWHYKRCRLHRVHQSRH